MPTNQEQLFTCHSCQLEWSYEFLQTKIEGKSYCVECVEKEQSQAKPQPKSFTCEFCHKQKQEKPIYAHVKNMPDKRDSRDIALICSYCSYARAKKENFYCPRTSSGRDIWDINIPEFDCYCPRN
jgi:hypothetical protein